MNICAILGVARPIVERRFDVIYGNIILHSSGVGLGRTNNFGEVVVASRIILEMWQEIRFIAPRH